MLPLRKLFTAAIYGPAEPGRVGCPPRRHASTSPSQVHRGCSITEGLSQSFSTDHWSSQQYHIYQQEWQQALSAKATADETRLPHYSKQEYWEQRYRNQLGAPEWYLGWPHLKRHLCDSDGILGPLALVPPALVLELGCGNFSLVPGLASSGFAALGTDFSPAATAEAAAAARSGTPDFATLDARVLPLRSGIFDAVLDKGCFLDQSRKRRT